MNRPDDPGLDPTRFDETIDQSRHIADDDMIDEIAEEFAVRCRRGELPSVESFVTRHPDHADRLRELLPTVAMMEQLKRRSNSARGGRESFTPQPERLGEFRIVRELGRGGMGVVYEAVQEPLGRHIALKVIHPGQVDPRRLARFRREAMVVAQLHHTNIVPIYAVGDQDGLPFFAMQYIQGDSLDAVIGGWRDQGTDWHDSSRWRFAARVAMEAAGAIQHAHDQGILHRDLKPANLLIDEDEAVWITDFGLAKLVGHDDLTHSGDVIGTLRYLAPEALEGQSSPKSDIYSLGLTLYEMLTSTPPFGDVQPTELLQRVGSGTLPRPRKLDPAIPRDLETIALKAIAREPAHRYSSAGAMARDLRLFLEDRPIRARPVTSFERTWRWSRRNRLLASLMATALSAVLLAAVVGWVGVLRTSAALELAERSNQVNTEIITTLVNTLVAREDSLARVPTAPTGPGGPGRPGGPDGFGRPGPMMGSGPDEPQPGSPGEQTRQVQAVTDRDILQLIASSYSRFATSDWSNPKLQEQAAWVFFKLGCLDERLGRVADAEAECDRALRIFEAPGALRAGSIKIGSLVKLGEMIQSDPKDPDLTERTRRRAERISVLLGRLPGMAREDGQVRMKLGRIFRKAELYTASEAEFRAAVRLAQAAVADHPENDVRRIELLETRLALAELLVGQGLLSPAWPEITPCFEEFEGLNGRVQSDSVAESLENLADVYLLAGKEPQADELYKQADVIDTRAHVNRKAMLLGQGDFGDHGGPPDRGGPPRGGPGRGPGRGPGWTRGGPPPLPPR